MKTKLTVQVYSVNTGKGKWEKRGEIMWDGKRLKASNDSLLLKNVISEPLWLRGGRELRSEDDPELFIRSLWQHYRSYVTVTKAT